MTKDHKILSLQLPAQELADLDAEAQAPPFHGNRSDYCRRILEGRHQMSIVAAPQAQQLTDYYTQRSHQQQQEYQDEAQQQRQDHQLQLDQRQAQVDQLNQRLVASEDRLRVQQEASDQLQSAYKDLYIKEQKQEYFHERDTERLEQTTQQVQEWKGKYEEAHQRADQLNQQLREAKGVTTWVDTLTKGMGNLVEKNPGFTQLVAEQGLQGLLFGKPRPKEAPVSSGATRLGQAMRDDFPGQQLGAIVDLLQYLRDHPQAKAQWLAKPEVVAHTAKRRAAEANKKAEANPQ